MPAHPPCLLSSDQGLAAALQALRSHARVAYVEQDQTVSLRPVGSPQNQAAWGLDRIDQVYRPLDTQGHFNCTGAGVNAFVIDTGIRAYHVECFCHMKPGFSAIANAQRHE